MLTPCLSNWGPPCHDFSVVIVVVSRPYCCEIPTHFYMRYQATNSLYSIHSFNETIYPAAALDKMECLTSDLDIFPLKNKIPFPQNMQPFFHLGCEYFKSVNVIFNDGS